MRLVKLLICRLRGHRWCGGPLKKLPPNEMVFTRCTRCGKTIWRRGGQNDEQDNVYVVDE